MGLGWEFKCGRAASIFVKLAARVNEYRDPHVFFGRGFSSPTTLQACSSDDARFRVRRLNKCRNRSKQHKNEICDDYESYWYRRPGRVKFVTCAIRRKKYSKYARKDNCESANEPTSSTVAIAEARAPVLSQLSEDHIATIFEAFSPVLFAVCAASR